MPAHRKYATPADKRAAGRIRERAMRAADPDRFSRKNREYMLRTKYGLTLEQRDDLLAAQAGKCALCSTPIAFSGKGLKAAHIDHDHASGRVRGILCGFCNTSLGRLGDSVERIEGVLAYLHRFGEN